MDPGALPECNASAKTAASTSASRSARLNPACNRVQGMSDITQQHQARPDLFFCHLKAQGITEPLADASDSSEPIAETLLQAVDNLVIVQSQVILDFRFR